MDQVKPYLSAITPTEKAKIMLADKRRFPVTQIALRADMSRNALYNYITGIRDIDRSPNYTISSLGGAFDKFGEENHLDSVKYYRFKKRLVDAMESATNQVDDPEAKAVLKVISNELSQDSSVLVNDILELLGIDSYSKPL